MKIQAKCQMFFVFFFIFVCQFKNIVDIRNCSITQYTYIVGNISFLMYVYFLYKDCIITIKYTASPQRGRTTLAMGVHWFVLHTRCSRVPCIWRMLDCHDMYTTTYKSLKISDSLLRRVWRYRRGNQNPYFDEEQITQWPKEKGHRDKQRSTKHTEKR